MSNSNLNFNDLDITERVQIVEDDLRANVKGVLVALFSNGDNHFTAVYIPNWQTLCKNDKPNRMPIFLDNRPVAQTTLYDIRDWFKLLVDQDTTVLEALSSNVSAVYQSEWSFLFDEQWLSYDPQTAFAFISEYLINIKEQAMNVRNSEALQILWEVTDVAEYLIENKKYPAERDLRNFSYYNQVGSGKYKRLREALGDDKLSVTQMFELLIDKVDVLLKNATLKDAEINKDWLDEAKKLFNAKFKSDMLAQYVI